MAEKEADLLVDEEDQATDAPELAIAQKKRALGTYVGAFFDELMRAGVRDVVVSPGSRSTPLSMVAHEAHARFGSAFNLYLDIDERGAAFFALGIAKATGRAVCVICTSGTALANYYPAVMEAEISRVPLIVLSGDRPARLQGLGAPQTCDQNKAFSDHVRRFFAMPEPSDSPSTLPMCARLHVKQLLPQLRGLMPRPRAREFPVRRAVGARHCYARSVRCGSRCRRRRSSRPGAYGTRAFFPRCGFAGGFP